MQNFGDYSISELKNSPIIYNNVIIIMNALVDITCNSKSSFMGLSRAIMAGNKKS